MSPRYTRCPTPLAIQLNGSDIKWCNQVEVDEGLQEYLFNIIWLYGTFNLQDVMEELLDL